MMLKTLLAITKISGIGDSFIHKNSSLFVTYSPSDVITKLSCIDPRINNQSVNENMQWANSIITRCTELDISIFPIYDKNYPPLLKEMSNAPAILYLKGNKSLLKSPIVSIIGTRHSSPLGNRIANKVGTYFSQHCSICNGLVDGIDKNSVICDDSVLPNVVGVLSGGLNYISTSSKVTCKLAEKVLNKNGLLISIVEPDRKEDQYAGSISSRIQAGLSSALILIQSSIDGGSKYTLKPFSKLNRVLGVISYFGNAEYEENESFSANRLIISKGVKGVRQILGLKKIDSLKIRKIHNIKTSNDYQEILSLIVDNKNSIEMYSLF